MKFAFGILLGIITLGETAPSDKIQNHELNRNIADFSNFWFKFTAENTDRKNFIASPISAWMALAMTSCGASGGTKTEIHNALNFPVFDDVTKNIMKQIIQGIKVPKNIEMKMANKLFVQSGFRLKQKFVNKIENILHSEVQSINFKENINASEIINGWVESKTNNRIKNLANPAEMGDAKLFLANTIYFKGEWKNTFDKRTTSPFYLNRSTTKNVKMMEQTDEFLYGDLENANAKFVVLPYVNEKFYMVIIVPNEIDGLEEVESKFENINFDGLVSFGNWKRLWLKVPKFKIESTLDMKPIFTKMGMKSMFDDRSANFSDITDDYPLKIDKALQKTFIEVNEVGTEAAVATGIKLLPIASVQQTIRLDVDRPFLFSIIMDSGDIRHQLFRGRIVDPLNE